ASATVDGDNQAQVLNGATIDCPDVATRLTEVPEQARGEVDKELAALDQQIADAYQRISESAKELQQDPDFAQNAIAGPREAKPSATLARIATVIDRVGDRPEGLAELATCTVRESGNNTAAQDEQDQQDGQAGDGGQDQAGQGQQDRSEERR